MTRRRFLRLGARAGAVLALLLLLILAEGADAYDIPYRQYYSFCMWQDLRGVVGGRLSYDVSDYDMVEWREGVENWDSALGSMMYFDLYSYSNGKTHLRWEGEPPSYDYCVDWAWACFKVERHIGSSMIESTIYFDPVNYQSGIEADRVAASAHEWGHNLNLGDYDPPRYFCDPPPRIMSWPDGVGCITGPSCAEQAAVIDYYMLLPWWHDRDGDCFDNDDEDFMGTDDWDDCPDGTWDDAWPPDVNNDAEVDILDVLRYKPVVAGLYDRRYDLNVDGRGNILDVLRYKPVIGTSCANP